MITPLLLTSLLITAILFVLLRFNADDVREETRFGWVLMGLWAIFIIFDLLLTLAWIWNG